MKGLNKSHVSYALLVLILVCSGMTFQWVFAQTKKAELTSRRSELNNEIARTKQLIKEYQADQRSASAELSLLNEQIRLREELIQSINSEVGTIDGEIKKGEGRVVDLEASIQDLKAEYAKMIYNSYKQRSSYSKLAFILSSSDFFQAVKRVQLLKQYAENRKFHAQQMKDAQLEIAENISMLEGNKQTKLALSSDEQSERNEIALNKLEQQKKLEFLKSEEGKLREIQRQKEVERRQLTNKIEEIVRQEIAAENERIRKQEAEKARLAEEKRKEDQRRAAANATASNNASANASGTTAPVKTNTPVAVVTPPKPVVNATPKMESAPEVVLANTVFEQNKGSLPWPIASGAVGSKFGRHAHESIAGIEVNNKGVDFITSANAEIFTVFNGTVTSVFNIQGAGMNVIVTHGAYKTVYSGLQNVYVSVGTKVNTKDKIGTVADNGEGYVLHFELGKVSEAGWVPQNPELWLKRR
ncbi:MAG: peptidoglycan DD-metalloendopeptidase family protein [Flavobacteriales bacterium]|jgi:murein hydrolase activator|nr:peptidoglycan DD-metalloendopeptidase family protein [Flavobacteriales bacterium]MDP4716322.1 peptidoglycan DD-metalloendopeptidase family protein [Flavobacteriales bacterium]MDP4817497.1 peptidoglycan DD-metalloendopeptidase family protein [Flavobacteriales bacterium]MDP4950749.1 peptidoglycan DD-metalloendopeptidase family protein [Flavobacteriales bacterium]